MNLRIAKKIAKRCQIVMNGYTWGYSFGSTNHKLKSIIKAHQRLRKKYSKMLNTHYIWDGILKKNNKNA